MEIEVQVGHPLLRRIVFMAGCNSNNKQGNKKKEKWRNGEMDDGFGGELASVESLWA